MDWTEIFLAVVAAVGAGVSGLFAYFGRQSQAKFEQASKADAAKQEQQVQFYATVIAECEKLRESNGKLQKQITQLQNEVHQLREQLEFYEENHLASEAREMLESVFNNVIAKPAWIHDLAANKWYVNDYYCREFRVSRNSFWTPINILGRYDIEDALKYTQNDMKVIDTGTAVEFEERVRARIMDPKCDEFVTGRFVKTPFLINERPYVVGKMLEKDGEPLV